MKWLFLPIFILVIAAAAFSVPVWKKNAFHTKQKEQRNLVQIKKALLQKNLTLDRDLHKLSKPSRIETIAKEHLNLEWGARPLEVERR